MTKTQARRKVMQKKKAQRYAAWTLFYIFELAAAVIPAGISAAILIPLAHEERGYMAMGGEWLAVALVFCIAYNLVHAVMCNKIFGEEEQEKCHTSTPAQTAAAISTPVKSATARRKRTAAREVR